MRNKQPVHTDQSKAQSLPLSEAKAPKSKVRMRRLWTLEPSLRSRAGFGLWNSYGRHKGLPQRARQAAPLLLVLALAVGLMGSMPASRVDAGSKVQPILLQMAAQ